jgi:hypothetical protein
VASTIGKPCCCCCSSCNSIYHLRAISTHEHCNFLDLELALTVLGRPVCSSSSKLSLPFAKCLCYSNSTAAQGFLTVLLLDHLGCFARGFA